MYNQSSDPELVYPLYTHHFLWFGDTRVRVEGLDVSHEAERAARLWISVHVLEDGSEEGHVRKNTDISNVPRVAAHLTGYALSNYTR